MPSSIKHKYIMKKRLITTITILFLAIMSSVAQTKSFKGTVIDNKDGQPVIGASVIVTDAKGKTITGVSTDLDGLFSISIPEAGKEIKVSSVGYLDYIAPARSASGVQIYLEQDSQTLDAVVVTALGITREAKSLNYSRQSVDASSMNEIKASDFVASLSGKVAGVSVTPSGVSNGTSRVVIRGTSSLTENSMPVFVIDGMVIENQPGDSGVGVDGGSGSLDMGNPAADINPDDIESVEVLKGPKSESLAQGRFLPRARRTVSFSSRQRKHVVRTRSTFPIMEIFSSKLLINFLNIKMVGEQEKITSNLRTVPTRFLRIAEGRMRQCQI